MSVWQSVQHTTMNKRVSHDQLALMAGQRTNEQTTSALEIFNNELKTDPQSIHVRIIMLMMNDGDDDPSIQFSPVQTIKTRVHNCNDDNNIKYATCLKSSQLRLSGSVGLAGQY